jgi:hypothetical protein
LISNGSIPKWPSATNFIGSPMPNVISVLYCIVSYHIISYHIELYHIVLYHIVSYRIWQTFQQPNIPGLDLIQS